MSEHTIFDATMNNLALDWQDLLARLKVIEAVQNGLMQGQAEILGELAKLERALRKKSPQHKKTSPRPSQRVAVSAPNTDVLLTLLQDAAFNYYRSRGGNAKSQRAGLEGLEAAATRYCETRMKRTQSHAEKTRESARHGAQLSCAAIEA